MKHLFLSAVLASMTATPIQAAEERDIATTAGESGSLKTLTAALRASGLIDTLKGKGPFTVFAPTDAAFAKLPRGTVASLLKPGQSATLRRILLHHVIAGRVGSAAALQATKATSLAGEALSIRLIGGRLRVGDATVTKNDIAATNGVIHMIDTVLIPPTPRTERDKVTELLELAIDRGVPLFNAGQPAACAAIYEVAVRAALDLGAGALGKRDAEHLSNALRSLPEARDDAARAWILRNAMDKLIAAPPAANATTSKEAFKPVREAKLPKGFPDLGPVGEVIVKNYPAYRAARAEGGNSFWTLFNHIKRNKIAMTAPVEMSMAEGDGDSGMTATDMAFLYEDTSLGKTGRDDSVDVVDVAPMRVLSVGIRGPMSPDKVEAAKKLIQGRLERDGLESIGEWRLLGYNSPMIPAEKRFWELQAPIAN